MDMKGFINFQCGLGNEDLISGRCELASAFD